MANAETFKDGKPNFFPLQGPRVLRGDDVQTPTDAANAEYPPVSNYRTQSEDDAVWAQYEAMQPATDEMERASNVGGPKKWLIPGVVAASFLVGIAYAALNDRPAQISEPTLASQQTPGTDTSATALMGGAASSAPGDPTVMPQSAFDYSAPIVSSRAQNSGGPSANGAVEKAPQPASKPAKVPPPIAEQALPSATYSRGDSITLQSPTPAPNTGPLTSPTPLPSAPAEEPAMKMDLAPPAEAVPAPGGVPDIAPTPQ